MLGRILASCGWLAWQISRPFGALARGRRASLPPTILAGVLVVLAAMPIVAPFLDPQPRDVTVQEVADGVAGAGSWVRLTGRAYPLRESPTGERGRYALFVDGADELRAVVVEGGPRLTADEHVQLTGTVTPGFAQVPEDLPIEATVFGTPPQVHQHALVVLDEAPTPPRSIVWVLAVPPLLLAAVLLVGARTGYPVFEPTQEVQVLAAPLASGERVPTAYGGRIGDSVRPLSDPGGALLLVRGGPSGNLLTAQPLPDGGGVAPQPVLIGGAWTSGRVGMVHTISETVPALVVRSELVDATFLFSRSAERDRVAALVAVER